MKHWTLKITKHWVNDDEWPDLSHLGEYRDDIPAGTDWDFVILLDLTEEYRYFVANVPLNEINDKTGKPYSRRTKQRWAKRQQERIDAFCRDVWNYVGLYAEAIVIPDDDSEVWSTRSGGLWQVESDSDKTYIESIWDEEIAVIREALTEVAQSFNLTPEQIEDAIQNAEEV